MASMRGELFSLIALLLNSVVQRQVPDSYPLPPRDCAIELASTREACNHAWQAVNGTPPCVCPACPVATVVPGEGKTEASLWKPAVFGAGGTLVANLLREAIGALSRKFRRGSNQRYGGRVAPARRGGGMVA